MFYWVAKYTLGVALKIVFRPWSRGRSNMPRRGPVILVSNHLSFADHFFVATPLRRKLVFLAKAEYFTGRGMRGLATKAFFSGVGQIPIDRTGGDASERAFNGRRDNTRQLPLQRKSDSSAGSWSSSFACLA